MDKRSPNDEIGRDVAQAFVNYGYNLGYDRAIEVLSNYGSEDVKQCIRLLRELDMELDAQSINADGGFYPSEDQRWCHLDTYRAT